MNKQYYPPEVAERASQYPHKLCESCRDKLEPRVNRNGRGSFWLETPVQFAKRRACSQNCGQVVRHKRKALCRASPAQIERVLAVLHEYRGMPLHAQDVIGETGMCPDTARDALKALVERGEAVKREGEGQAWLYLVALEEAA